MARALGPCDAAKYRVRDGSNREWVVKVGGEPRPETVAGRLVWAAGYYTDITWLEPRIEIEGVGVFENAKFEARSKGVKRLDEWLWDDNPFIGTTEFQALKVLLVLLDNWNLKNENNTILYTRGGEAEAELLYIISDFDTTSDKSGAAPMTMTVCPDMACSFRPEEGPTASSVPPACLGRRADLSAIRRQGVAFLSETDQRVL